MPVAVHEHPEFLHQALISIRSQTLLPARVIIGFDGRPPDPLQKIVAKFVNESKMDVEVLMHDFPLGISATLNHCLEKSNALYVARLDSDDVCWPERLEVQYRALIRNPEVVVLGSWVEEFDTTGKRRNLVRKVPATGGQILDFLKFRNAFNHQSVVLNREEVISVGGYREVSGFEDYDLWLRLAGVKDSSAFRNVPVVLVDARVGMRHLDRRRGRNYARAEIEFFLGAAREGYLPLQNALFNIALRMPLRLFPSIFLKIAMRIGRQRA